MTRKHGWIDLKKNWSIQRTKFVLWFSGWGPREHPKGLPPQRSKHHRLVSWQLMVPDLGGKLHQRIPQIRWFTMIFTLEKTIWDGFGMNSFLIFLGPHLEDVSYETSFRMKLHRASFLNVWIKTWYYCKQIYKRNNPKRDISKGPVEAEWLGTFALRSSLSGAGHGKPCRICCGF